MKNSKGNEALWDLQGLFSPETTDFGCFCSRVWAVAGVAVAGARGGSYVFRVSPSSAQHLANDTCDIGNHKCGWSCEQWDSGEKL